MMPSAHNQISDASQAKCNRLLLALFVLLLVACDSTTQAADPKTRSIRPPLADDVAVVVANVANLEFADDRIVRAVIAATRQDSVWDAIGRPCRSDLNRTFEALGRRDAWAIAMFDASVKLPAGVEHGAVYQFGNFDECMAVDAGAAGSPVQPQYCLADVQANGYRVRSGASRHFELHNSTTIHWAVCLPATCTPDDTARLLAAWTANERVHVAAERCHRRNETVTFTALDVLVSCVIMAMVSMVVFCTGFDAVAWATGRQRKRHHRRNNAVEQVIVSFSLIANMKKLGQASRDELGLSAINGIKAFAMIFIIAGHALLFMVGGPQLNVDFYASEIQHARNAVLLNSPLLVDTFLLLSGFLFAHLVLVELEKRRGSVNFGVLYAFRYVRLTPAYLAVIALYATWLPKLGSGPLWDERMRAEQQRCRSSWWLNVLYINNYVGTDEICMFQSWYLAADTQLFVLAPLIVYPLWRWRRAGIALLGGVAAVSVLVPGLTTLIYDTDPSLLPFADEVEDITSNGFYRDWYIKTHMRATSYLFGIIAGFLVHYVRENDIKLSRTMLWLCWLTASAAGIASMFTIVAFIGAERSGWLRALYAGLHRLGWSYATGWIVFACALDYAGPIRAVLSSRALVPLSRLTYCAYLMNGLVELYQAATIRTPKYMSTINMLGETTSHVLLTFLGALALCLVFESPIHGLEKIFLRRSTGGGGAQHAPHLAQKGEQHSDSSLGPNTESDSACSQ